MFEDNKGVTRHSKSKTGIVKWPKAKKTKGQTLIYKILQRKLNIDQHESH